MEAHDEEGERASSENGRAYRPDRLGLFFMTVKLTPADLLPIEDRETIELRIVSFGREMAEHPVWPGLPRRTYPTLWIDITEMDGLPFETRWWIISRRLDAMLEPMLKEPEGIPATYRIFKVGIPPKTYYRVERI